MQIHELNNFTGTLGSGAYLAIDDGNDTGKISSQDLLAATEARIDNIIAGPAPSAEEIVDARLGADGVTYPSLGDAIRDQFSDVKSDSTNLVRITDQNLLYFGHDLAHRFYVQEGEKNSDNCYIDQVPIDISVSKKIIIGISGYGNVTYTSPTNIQYLTGITGLAITEHDANGAGLYTAYLAFVDNEVHYTVTNANTKSITVRLRATFSRSPSYNLWCDLTVRHLLMQYDQSGIEDIYKYDMQETDFTWVDGYYVDAHEAPQALASTRYAAFDVQEGEKYWVQGTNYYSAAAYRVFNANHAQLIRSNATTNFGYVSEVITIPKGGVKLYVGTYLTSTNNILNFGNVYKLVKKADFKTYAKSKAIKWEAIGDSITATATLRSLDGNYQMPNYVDFVSEWLGIEAVNRGSSGTGYITNNSGYSNTFVERSTTVSADTDLVTFFGSFNDPYDENYSVGSISDAAGANTLYGAIKACINNVYAINPSAQILLITPQPWASTNEVSGSRKEIAKNYVKAILDVGALYSVPVLDLYHESGMHPWDDSFKNKYYYNNDGTHPLSTAHKEFIAPKIMAKIKELFVL